MEERFKNVVMEINKKKIRYANKIHEGDKLVFYQYYKQAIDGDCNKMQPDIMKYQDYIKWKAWYSLLGTTKESAMEKYIQKYHDIITKYCIHLYLSDHEYI